MERKQLLWISGLHEFRIFLKLIASSRYHYKRENRWGKYCNVYS
jgi:hypothetical protein